MPKKNTQAQNNSNLPNQEQDLENDFQEQEEETTENLPNQEDGFFFGNKDRERRHKLPNDWAKKVCVYQCQIEQMNGGIVEIPNTHQLQTYEPAAYDKLIADEKGKPSFFSESKMKVTVLHDPR